MATHNIQDLKVWNKSMDLVEDVYKVINKLPRLELYALSDQIRRSAVSVPSNIAEGQKRSSRLETLRFTSIALGSMAELETQLLLCKRIYKLDVSYELDQCQQIGKMLTSLIKSLRSKL